MSYPTNPTTGDTYILSGKTWKYDGANWLKLGLSQAVSTNVAFSDLTSTPTTLAGYGITDGATGTGESVPVGTVIYHSANTPPTNFIKANGDAVSRTTYSDLFTVIGTTYGAGDGSTTFNVPDLRGEFMRGWDDSRGIDNGRSFGSAQADELKAHTHNYTDGTNGTNPTGTGAGTNNSFPVVNGRATSETGGTETRPRNIALLACIKYQSTSGSGSSAGVAFSDLTSTPTTLAGYGITDGGGGGSYANSDVDTHLNQGTATSNQVLSWNGTDYAWVSNSIANSSVSAGTVIYHAANTPPTNFIKANGAAISRTTYSDLFAAIGTTFGSGDGSSTFNVPDLRGEFPRGWDDGRGIDTSRAFGSAQADELKSHTHTVYNGTAVDDNRAYSAADSTQRLYSGSPNRETAATGGTETRPRNIALLACIKYQSTSSGGGAGVAFSDLTNTPTTLSGYGITGDIDAGGNKVLFANMYATEGDLPSATTYHGMFAHVHSTGAGYFAHAGNWVKLANHTDLSSILASDYPVEPNWNSHTEEITTSSTWTKPAALSDDAWVIAYGVGGGGAGGHTFANKTGFSSIQKARAGAGGGAMIIALKASTLNGASFTIGSGGIGSTSSQGPAGGNTTITTIGTGSTIYTAAGGEGGIAANSGASTGGGGQIIWWTRPGENDISASWDVTGGGSGAGADTSFTPATEQFAGGASQGMTGNAGAGAFGVSTYAGDGVAASTTNVDGVNGGFPGGGGGATHVNFGGSTTTTVVTGDGANGSIRLYYTI